MGNFILLKHINIKAKNPDVEYKNSNTSPSREISGKLFVSLQTYMIDLDNYD